MGAGLGLQPSCEPHSVQRESLDSSVLRAGAALRLGCRPGKGLAQDPLPRTAGTRQAGRLSSASYVSHSISLSSQAHAASRRRGLRPAPNQWERAEMPAVTPGAIYPNTPSGGARGRDSTWNGETGLFQMGVSRKHASQWSGPRFPSQGESAWDPPRFVTGRTCTVVSVFSPP